ncbi:kyphoscoliosis peptidase-like [Branchiostoma floridae x Branchiostoma belcheri]
MGSSCSSTSSAAVVKTGRVAPTTKRPPVTEEPKPEIPSERGGQHRSTPKTKDTGKDVVSITSIQSQVSHLDRTQDTSTSADTLVQYEKRPQDGVHVQQNDRWSSISSANSQDSIESLCKPENSDRTSTPKNARTHVKETESHTKKLRLSDQSKAIQNEGSKNNTIEAKKPNSTTASTTQLSRPADRGSFDKSDDKFNGDSDVDTEAIQNSRAFQNQATGSCEKLDKEKPNMKELKPSANNTGTNSDEETDTNDKKEINSVPFKTVEQPEITRRLKKTELIPDLSVFKELDDYAKQTPEHAEASMRSLVDYLIRPTKTPLETIRVLFMWMATHVKYDVSGYVTGTTYGDSSPEAVFRTRAAVCQGYADLFAELCRLADIPCKTISGKAKGINYVVGAKFREASNHAWNAVQINGFWYLLDCTWAAGHSDISSKTFVFSYTEHYFLTDPEFLVADHLPLDDSWQLLEDPVSVEMFESWLLLKPAFFDLGMHMSDLSHSKARVPTKSGSATIKLSLHEPMSFVVHLKSSDGKKKSTDIKNCVLHEIVDMEARFRVIPPTEGNFRLTIFAKKGTSSGSHEFLLEYLIQCKIPKAKAASAPFPSRNGRTIWGPGHFLLDGVISGTSHPEAIIDVPEGDVKIQFEFESRMRFMCHFGEDSRWNEYVFTEPEDACATFYLRCPEPGMHTLTIWAKEDTDPADGSYHKHCSYIIRCKKSKPKCLPYPKTFKTWTSGCKVFRPQNGHLASNRAVLFRVRWPKVIDVAVVADGKWSHLVQGSDDCWEGNATTGARGTSLHVVGKRDPNVNSYEWLLDYKVT